MSVLWRCDRCSKKSDDKGAMVSYPPKEWQAYQLVKIVGKNGGDFKDSVVVVCHLCEHCQSLPGKPEIKFA